MSSLEVNAKAVVQAIKDVLGIFDTPRSQLTTLFIDGAATVLNYDHDHDKPTATHWVKAFPIPLHFL